MIKSFFLLLIKFYQVGISPFLGSNCRFYPTCSHYCQECLEEFSIPKALWYSFRRIIRCHPFNKGGFDPIPRE